MKKLIFTISILSCINAVADSNKISVWQDFGQNSKDISDYLSSKPTVKQRRLLLDESLLKSRLSSFINSGIAAKSTVANPPSSEINLPLPDGTSIRVKATPSKVMTAAMAESYPELKTWTVTGIDDPEITGVIDFTTNGFHGMLMMPDGDIIYIDPDKTQAGDVYNSFSKKENAAAFDVKLNCEIHEDHDDSLQYDKHVDDTEFAIKTAARVIDDSAFPDVSIANTKTYRLALSATAEYTANRGGTAGARSSMVTSINRINPIFNRDLGVSLELIDSPNLIFSDAATDPFSNPDNPNTLMRENGNHLSDQNRLGDFDLGHVLSHRSTGGGSGVAFLGVACRGDVNTSNLGLIKGLKAAGATTSSNPTGSTFDLVLLAHELGHQLGANHSFNSAQGGNCSNGRSGTVAVEPGSGSTIMSYSGLCGSDNLPDTPRDTYFHFASITQVNNYTRSFNGASCGTDSVSSSVPTANAGNDIKIPANTPFLLDGTASGGTSSWDQIDIGDSSAVDIDNGENAIIRHIIPSSEQDRYIPSLVNLFANTNSIGEIMPTTTRELNFAYVVRDDGVVSDKKLINVTDTGSVFSVTSQTSNQTFITNQSVDVTWNAANTNQTPVSCSSVNIQLIRENGVKNMLLAVTPNDGTQSFVVPNATPVLSGARVLVGCSDNSFFNISSGDINVQGGTLPADTTAPVITIQGINPVSIGEGANYTDAGATAFDTVDGTVAVTSTGNVDTNTIGTYTITYTTTDAAGNSDTATRTINVTAAPLVADTTAPVITLNGASSVSIVESTNYTDVGATAFDNIDGTIAVTSTDNVNINTVGTYTVTYSATDAAGNNATATRTVNVTAAPVVVSDTTDPVITLNGDNPITIVEGTSYTDAGATATDNVDGSVTVTSTGSVNTNTIGIYTILYTATDVAGNSVSATRTVNVIANPSIDNNLGGTDGGGGGGSFGYLLMPLMILLGLRRPRPVPIRVKSTK